MRKRHRVLVQHRRLVGVHAQDQIAVAHGDELVERVHHLQQVERQLVVRIDLERRLERGARRRLVAGAQQLQAEIAERLGVVRVQGQRAARQLHRLVEAVVVRGQVTGDR